MLLLDLIDLNLLCYYLLLYCYVVDRLINNYHVSTKTQYRTLFPGSLPTGSSRPVSNRRSATRTRPPSRRNAPHHCRAPSLQPHKAAAAGAANPARAPARPHVLLTSSPVHIPVRPPTSPIRISRRIKRIADELYIYIYIYIQYLKIVLFNS